MRQYQVLVGLASGLTAKQIAHELMIDEKTAQGHRASLQRTLGIKGRANQALANLTRYAVKERYVDLLPV